MNAVSVRVLGLFAAIFWLAGVAVCQGPPSAPGASNAQTKPPATEPQVKAEDSAKPAKAVTLQDRAKWMLEDGLKDPSGERRARAVAALGLLPGDAKARADAVKALKDDKSGVRAAAATALGSMHAMQARHELEAMLNDSDPTVVMAAANSLLELKDRAAYQVYYGVLTGEQKATKSFVEQKIAMLHDKKKMAQLGLDEGIGFVPFAGIPYSVLKMVLKDNSAGARATAAQHLAKDPDPASRDALIDALGDKSWVVRVAALGALAHRRDSSVLPKIAPSLDDDNEQVRFFAAACVLELTRLKDARRNPEGTAEQTTTAKANSGEMN